MYSIQKLKEETPAVHLTSSPKKSDKVLRCAVLTKGGLKPTATGNQMFSMTLCDKDPSATIKAVCFEESFFHVLQPLKTYILKGYKIKRGFGITTMQIQINSDAQIELSKLQYKIEKQTFNISQIIRKETQNIKTLNVKCKIISIEDLKLVGKYPNQFQKRDVICADSTGSITLVLWRERANNVEFEVGDTITIENATTSSFNNNINLTTTGETIITKINDDELGSVQPEMCCSQQQNQVITSVNTRILAVKEFKTTCHCINCRNNIVLPPQNDDSTPDILTCPLCTSMFLLEDGKITNECSILLSNNKQWFLAKTMVSLLFLILYYLTNQYFIANNQKTDEQVVTLNVG